MLNNHPFLMAVVIVVILFLTVGTIVITIHRASTQDPVEVVEQPVAVNALQEKVQKLAFGSYVTDVREQLLPYLRNSDENGDYYVIWFKVDSGCQKGYYISTDRNGRVVKITTEIVQ